MNEYNNYWKIHIATLIVLGIILKSTSSTDSSLFLTLPLKPLMAMSVDLSTANLSLEKGHYTVPGNHKECLSQISYKKL